MLHVSQTVEPPEQCKYKHNHRMKTSWFSETYKICTVADLGSHCWLPPANRPEKEDKLNILINYQNSHIDQNLR